MSERSIVIVNYGVGNLYNVEKAFRNFIEGVVISSDPKVIENASALVLPGVGSFPVGMKGLEERGLIDPIRSKVESGAPLLGICLGAQLLLSEGCEFGTTEGLGLIPGQVVPFPDISDGTKVPHVGWNGIEEPKEGVWQGTVLSGVEKGSPFYFLHSFIMEPHEPKDVFAVTTYGGHTFASAVKKGNVIGCQFHPEKSADIGLHIVESFIKLSAQDI